MSDPLSGLAAAARFEACPLASVDERPEAARRRRMTSGGASAPGARLKCRPLQIPRDHWTILELTTLLAFVSYRLLLRQLELQDAQDVDFGVLLIDAEATGFELRDARAAVI